MELEDKYSEPHSFVSFKVGSTQYECGYCHHLVRDKEGKLLIVLSSNYCVLSEVLYDNLMCIFQKLLL